MVSIVAAIVSNIAKYAVGPIKKQFRYVFCFNTNVENLRVEAVRLNDMKAEVEIQVSAAVRNAEIINPATERWLLDAVKNGEEAQTIIQNKDNFTKGCFNRWCINLKPCYVLSRNAKKKAEYIIKLRQDGKFGRVSFPPQLTPVVDSTSTIDFWTRKQILGDIIRNLKDDNINMIGICGMGGVGKTTMADKVYERVKEEKLFDDYAMTVISQELDIQKAQKDIAEMLGLELNEKNPRLREAKLHKRIENSRVLVILDDVWAEFDLKELGITFQGLQKGCKILFTAREQGLWRQRKAKIDYPLDILTEEEAWELFKVKVNDSLEDESELQSVAKEIVKECGGLPLALVIIGGLLKEKNIHLWRDTLRQLKTDYPTKILGVSAKVYLSLELSYKFLDEVDAKSLFLLCSMFEEDYDIHAKDLIRMVLGLRLFKGINDLERTIDRVFALLEQLKNRYLLLPGKTQYDHLGSRIRVHDVVRDVAKSIAMVENGALAVENHDGVTMLQEHDTVKDSVWMSIISKDIKELPTELRFPRVKLLRCNNNVLQTTVSFLEEMREIRVLDVHGTGSLPFPSLLQLPSSLLTLFFRNCHLNDLSAIGDMPHLECLSFERSRMKELPIKIGHLFNLVSLDLTECSELRTIQPGIILGLCQLQELYMGNIPIDWERGENKQGRNASLAEFESLSYLHTLHIKIKDPIALTGSLLFSNLKKYQIQIGDGYAAFGSYDKCCSIHLSMPVPLKGNIKFLTKNSQELRFRGEFTKDLVHELVQDGSRSLKSLDVSDIDSLEYLANAEASLLLSSVESLHLRNLRNLKQLSRSPLMGRSFENLKDLKVRYCDNLKNLFQLSVATGFVHLKNLFIRHCERMEEVIWKEHKEDETNKLAFPKLQELEIKDLPSLVSFCRGIDEVEFPQLKGMWLRKLPKVQCLFSGFHDQSFFPHKVSFPSMKSINISDMENMKEIWCGQLQSGSSCNLTDLEVNSCHKLRAVFTPSQARYLLHLQTLYIEDCSLLEIVVAKEDGVRDTTLFPKLKEVVLNKLQALERFCHVTHELEYPMLSDLKVIDCPQLKTFSPGFVHTPKLNNVSLTYWKANFMREQPQKQVTLWEDNLNSTIAHLYEQYQFGSRSLISFEVSDMDTLENLANAEASSLLFTTLETLSLENMDNSLQLSHCPLVVILRRFKNLTGLCVSKCHQLKNLFLLSVATEFMHLKKIVIKDCKNMEEVIRKEQREDETNKLVFPKLEQLIIDDLPSLVSFCRGIDEVEFHHLSGMYLKKLPKVESLFSGMSNQSFFLHKVSFPSLKSISLKDMVNMKEIWCGQLQSNLTHLFVEGCDKLRAVFRPSAARYLVHLECLFIKDCSLLEIVVAKEEEEDGMEDTTLLPELWTIELNELPALESFCHVAHDLEYPKLRFIHVINCPELKTFSLGFVRTPELNNVSLTEEDAEKQVTIWEDNLNSTIEHLHKQNQEEQRQHEDGIEEENIEG